MLADDLSRDNLASLLSKVPDSDAAPSSVSTALLNLLLSPEVVWVSPEWQSLFSGNSGLQRPLGTHTTLG